MSNLSLLRRIAVFLPVAGSALQVWTVLFGQNFFVSPQYFRAAVFPAAIVAIYVGLSWRGLALAAPISDSSQIDGFKIRPEGFAQTFVVPAILAIVLTFIPLLQTFPYLLNRAVGVPTSETFTVVEKKYQAGGRRGPDCNRIKVRELREHWFGKICVSDKAFSEVRVSGELSIQSTRSWFGVGVERYAPNT